MFVCFHKVMAIVWCDISRDVQIFIGKLTNIKTKSSTKENEESKHSFLVDLAINQRNKSQIAPSLSFSYIIFYPKLFRLGNSGQLFICHSSAAVLGVLK